MRLSFLATYSVLSLHLLQTVANGQSVTADRATFDARSALSFSLSYAPTSSHILIGHAQDRRITQSSLGYEHILIAKHALNISYEGSIVPLFLESDITAKGTSTPNASGPPTVVYGDPVRLLGYGTLGYVYIGIFPNSQLVPVTAIEGPRQITYAFAALPVGARFNGIPNRRIQPTFAVNLGALYAARNIPVDDTASFNFLAYAGPGVEFVLNSKRSVRLEYLYEHLSNANIGQTNPGIDSASFRLTLIRHH